MVMVANKKTEAQMTEDLSLFLGHHTNKFTSWFYKLCWQRKLGVMNKFHSPT
jgi:hypothetical protein